MTTSGQKTAGQLKALHGQDYADRFEKQQDPYRLGRLVHHMDLQPWHEVADFACGNGMMLELLARAVRSYTGVDFSEPFIESANMRKEKLGAANARFECASIEDFCARHGGEFDRAFAMDFSEHVYDEDWRRLLKSMRGALKASGKLYLHTPNAGFLLERMKRRNFILRQLPEHIAVRTLAQNARLLDEAGFRVSRARMLPHYNVLRLLHPLSFVPGVGRLFQARIFIEAVPA